jgi:hypothetical protein
MKDFFILGYESEIYFLKQDWRKTLRKTPAKTFSYNTSVTLPDTDEVLSISP